MGETDGLSAEAIACRSERRHKWPDFGQQKGSLKIVEKYRTGMAKIVEEHVECLRGCLTMRFRVYKMDATRGTATQIPAKGSTHKYDQTYLLSDQQKGMEDLVETFRYEQWKKTCPQLRLK